MLGNELARLADCNRTTPKIEFVFRCAQVEISLESLLTHEFPGVQSSRAAGRTLAMGLREAKSWPEDETQYFAGTTVEEGTLMVLTAQKAAEFFTVLYGELDAMRAYRVGDKGIYKPDVLVGRAEMALPPSMVKKLTKEVREELREGGRCFAFDTYTASGFHLLRAVERVMQQFFVAVRSENSEPPPAEARPLDEQNWGFFITQFRRFPEPRAKKVAEQLQQLKDQDRNLIMHPRASLIDEDVYALLPLAMAAIMAMVPVLPDVEEE